jgi:pimeloyl-ACP methyl ester carboxylesterase/DNA-binding CsgD family transcriptional regulator
MPNESRQTIRICSTVDGVSVAHARSGRGPPLVFAPGWFTHLQFNWESAVWRHWNEALSERRTLVRYDPRGCGLSDRNVQDLSFDGWIRDLEAVADANGLRRFPILGFCQGAAVAVAYAARHPERIGRLVLYGSYPRGVYAGGDAEAIRLARGMREIIDQGWGVDVPAYQELFAKLLMPEGGPEMLRWLCEQQRRSTSAHSAARFFDVFQSFDVRAAARSIAQPVLVAHLRHDCMIPFERGREMAALLPDARFVPLEGRNHMMLPDEPAWSAFVSVVSDFLAEEADEAFGDPASDFDALTARERVVLESIADGLSNDEIAARLYVSPKTVRNHVTRIFDKLGVDSRPQAIVHARRAGIGH